MGSSTKVALTTFDKSVEAIAIVLLVTMWLAAIYGYIQAPDIVPIHFNGSGEPDGFGSKATIFLMPAIGSALYALITFINQYPQIFNYPVTITDENRQRNYQYATRMLRILKLCLLLIFNYSVIEIYLASVHKTEGLGRWTLFIIIFLVNVPLIYFIVKMVTKPKAPNNLIDGA